MLVVLVMLVVSQVAVSSRHLDRAPDVYLKEALALETLIRWSRACLYPELSVSISSWDTSGWRELLGDIARALFHKHSPTVLTIGGVQLKALELLINGSDELQPSTLKRLAFASISSLLSAGVPHSLVEEAVSTPSANSLLKLFAYASRAPSTKTCFRDLAFKVVSFSIYAEKGNIGKAKAIAEEVLNARSAFFGLIMFFILEKTPATYVSRAPGFGDISEEVIEKLMSILEKQNVSIGEVLAKYSIAELVELYERLTDIAEVELLLEGRNITADSTGLSNSSILGIEVNEDVLRYSALAGIPQGSSASEGEENTWRSEGFIALNEQELSKLVSRIPHQVVTAVFSAVSRAEFREYLDSRARQKVVAPIYTPVSREQPPDLGVALAVIALAFSAGCLSQLALRKSSVRSISLGRLPSLAVKAGGGILDPVIKFFWDVVSRLAISSKIEILQSDTHREIVGKLSPRVDDVVSAGLVRLGKLYEVVRYSRTTTANSLIRDLEILRKIFGDSACS